MKRNKMTLYEEMNMDNNQYSIMRHIQRLDQVSVEYEARWGVDRLPDLVPAALKEKWERQWQKLDAAIAQKDAALVEDLAQGCIRAWVALEAEAIKGGHKQISPDAWEVRHPESGQVYRICKNRNEALVPAAAGVVTYTLEEIANLMESNQSSSPANRQVKTIPLANIDWQKGDDLPF